MTEYKFIGKSAYLQKEKILVIADLHLGYEESLAKKGIFLPRRQFKDIIGELEKIFEEICGIDNKKINEVVILGDLKHEFSGNLHQEWRDFSELIDFLKKKAKKIILIKGNHDNYLANAVKNREKIELKDFYIKDENAFVHGDKSFPEMFDKKIRRIFLGHIHPAITIKKHAKTERYKCFLAGKFKNKEIIILPSFFPLVEGMEVDSENDNLAIKLDLNKFNVFIPAGLDVLDFGKVKSVGRLM